MKKILVTMMVLALTIGAQAQQYDGIQHLHLRLRSQRPHYDAPRHVQTMNIT